MSDDKKRYKYRKNVSEFVDCDYKSKLSEEELKFYEQFENEYYSNAVANKRSLHRERLSEDDFKRCKKETFDMTNAQNRDAYAISKTSSAYLKFIDDDNCFIQLESDGMNLNTLFDPKSAMETLMNEVIDEISNDSGRDLEEVLHEFAYECTKLGATIKPYKVNASLRQQKRKKKEQEEES